MPATEKMIFSNSQGALRLETLLSIADEYRLPVPRSSVEALRPRVQMMPGEPYTWEQFLSKFAALRQFYRSEAIVKRITREAIADAAVDNVRCMELRFTPQALNNILNATFAEVVEWVCAAGEAASALCDIQVKLILSMNRHESVEIGEQMLVAAGAAFLPPTRRALLVTRFQDWFDEGI